MILLSLFSLVSCSVIGWWWLGWGHLPKERRLPIGFLSAHVTAATVHVLSRVSPITLALSPSLTLTYSHNATLAHFLLMFLVSSGGFFVTVSVLLFFYVSALFHYFMSFPLFSYPYLSHLSLFLMFYHHLSPPSPPQLTSQESFCFSPTFSPSHPTLNFKPCSSYLSPSLAVSGNRLHCPSLLTPDYWCSQSLAKTDLSLFICIKAFARVLIILNLFFPSPKTNQGETFFLL